MTETTYYKKGWNSGTVAPTATRFSQIMHFLDPVTNCFATYHPIPKKKEIKIIMKIAITMVEMIITQVKKQNKVA